MSVRKYDWLEIIDLHDDNVGIPYCAPNVLFYIRESENLKFWLSYGPKYFRWDILAECNSVLRSVLNGLEKNLHFPVDHSYLLIYSVRYTCLWWC